MCSCTAQITRTKMLFLQWHSQSKYEYLMFCCLLKLFYNYVYTEFESSVSDPELLGLKNKDGVYNNSHCSNSKKILVGKFNHVTLTEKVF